MGLWGSLELAGAVLAVPLAWYGAKLARACWPKKPKAKRKRAR